MKILNLLKVKLITLFCSHDKQIALDVYPETEWLDNGLDSKYESCTGIAKKYCVNCKLVYLTKKSFLMREKGDQNNIIIN